MATIVTKNRDMDAHASDAVVWGLVARLERDGHYLTPSAVAKIHQAISDCIPDHRTEGTQKELSAFIRERMERDCDPAEAEILKDALAQAAEVPILAPEA